MKHLLTFSGLLLLSACVSLPVPDGKAYSEPVPVQWSETFVAGEVADAWWTRFGDPRMDVLIAEAIFENPQVLSASARTDAARAQARIAGADQLPSIAANFNASRSKQGSAAFAAIPGLGDLEFGGPQNNFSLQGQVSWELDLWGRIAAQSEAANEDYLAAVENQRAVQQSLAAQTARLYFSVIEARQQVALSEQTMEGFTETLRQISNRAAVGVGSPTDEQLAISNLENARAGLEQGRIALEQVTRQLEVLLRDYPEGRIAVPEGLPALPPQPPAGLPSELLIRRPDVIAAERALRAAGLREEAARKSRLPSLSLNGSGGAQDTDVGDLFDGDLIWSIAGAIVQPIFQGGRIRASIDLADANQRAAAESYVQTALNAFREVETALAIDTKLASREASLLRAADAAREAERIAFNRFREGLTPFLTVVEAQQRALNSQSQFLSARRARLDNRVDLHLALGGGFDQLNTVEVSR